MSGSPAPQTLKLLKLRFLVPLAILLCAVTVGLVNLHVSTRDAERRVDEQARNQLAQRMLQLQDALEFLLKRGELERVQEEVAALGADPDVVRAVFIAADGTVLAATRRDWIGRPAAKEWMLGSEPRTRSGNGSPSLRSGAPVTRFASDRERLLGYAPVAWNTHPWEQSPPERGAVFLELDLSRLKQAASRQVLEVILPQALTLALVAAALWLLFHFALTRRVNQLVRAAERLERGDWDARTGVSGRDELALVAHAFDQAVASVRVTQRALQEREADVRQLLESTAEGIVGLSRDGRCTFCNPAAARLLGYDGPGELLGQSGHLLWHHSRPDGSPYPAEECPLWRAGRDGSTVHLDHEAFWRADGRRFDVEAWAHPLFREGNSAGVVLTFVDITLRKRAEDAQRFLLHATEQLAQGLDAEGTLASLSRLAIPFLADWCVVDTVEPSGAIRRAASAHVDPARAPLLQVLQQRYPPGWHTPMLTSQVLATGKPQLIPQVTSSLLEAYSAGLDHARLLEQLGTRTALAVPLRVRGQLLGVLLLASGRKGQPYDEHELRLAEELTRRAGVAIDNARLYQQAQDAIRLRDEFLSIASHELRTPLTPLQLQLQLVRRAVLNPEAADGTKLQRNLDVTLRQVQRLTRLIDDLLDVSRIVGGRLKLHLEPLDLVEVTREVLERFAEQAREKGSELRFEGDTPVRGRWDRLRLEQVITNLVSNALKYGGGKPIEVRVGVSAGAAEWSIRDYGIGIAEEALQRIFGRFERAVSTRAYGGLGLGLYISQQIMEAHGGRIQVQSRPGEGSTFSVQLPFQPTGRGAVRFQGLPGERSEARAEALVPPRHGP